MPLLPLITLLHLNTIVSHLSQPNILVLSLSAWMSYLLFTPLPKSILISYLYHNLPRSLSVLQSSIRSYSLFRSPSWCRYPTLQISSRPSNNCPSTSDKLTYRCVYSKSYDVVLAATSLPNGWNLVLPSETVPMITLHVRPCWPTTTANTTGTSVPTAS